MRSLSGSVLPPSLAALYHAYSFGDADKSPAFAYDSVEQWRQVTEVAQARLSEVVARLGPVDGRLAAQEAEFMEKLGVCWRLRGQGTLYEPDPKTAYTTRNAVQAAKLAGWLRVQGKYYVARLQAMDLAELRALYDGAPLKLNKGKGAPYWNPGSDKEVTFAYGKLAQGCRSYTELETRVRNAASARLPMVQTSYTRIQSARGSRPRVIVIQGKLQLNGERFGPKIRRIAAQPFAVNHLWAGVGNVLRTLMATKPGGRTTGTPDTAMRLAKERKYAVAVDLKSYDTTVAIETLDMVSSMVMAPALEVLVRRGIIPSHFANLLLDCDWHTQRLSIILPPRTLSEAAFITEAEGQTRSGENLTSWKGTVINDTRCEAKIQELRLSKSATTVNYGDDTMLFTDSKEDVDRWLENDKMFGFNEEAAPDATFLMRRMPQGYSYLGRMVMGSIDREPAHEPANIVSAAAAFAIRNELLTGHPAQRHYYEIMREVMGPTRLQVAVDIARANADPVALAIQAYRMTPQEKGQQKDDRLDALRALASQPGVTPGTAMNAARAVLWIEQQETALGSQIQWKQFQTTSSGLSYSQAEALIRDRAYTTAPIMVQR